MITLDTVEENGLEVDKGEMEDRLVAGCRSLGRRCYGLPDGSLGDLGREWTSENSSRPQGLLLSPGSQNFVMTKITGSTKCHLLSLAMELSISHVMGITGVYHHPTFTDKDLEPQRVQVTCPSHTVNFGQFDSRTHAFNHSVALSDSAVNCPCWAQKGPS